MSTLKTNNIQHVDRSDPSIIISTDGGVSIAGTLTYEDVTNIDAVGIVTGRELINAQKQLHVGTGVSVKSGGLNVTAGITTLGGDVSIAGVTTISYDGTAQYGLDVSNSTSGSSGVRISAGDNDAQYSFLVENRLGSNLFEVMAGGGGANLRSGSLFIPDKLIHHDDTNTAIRFPSNDTITAETAGSERLRIDSSGNIGINNSSPSYILSVNGDSGISVTASSNSTEGVLSIVGRNSGGGVPAISRFKSYPEGSGNQSHLAIETRTSSSGLVEAMRITSSQNVGIATNNPAGRLDVHGSGSSAIIRARRIDGNGGYNLFEGYSDVNAASTFYVSNNGDGYFNSNLLIGTTTAGTGSGDDLTISRSGNMGLTLRSTNSNYCNIYFSDATAGTATYEGYISYNHATDSLEFATVHTERLRIASNGAVAISGNRAQVAPTEYNDITGTNQAGLLIGSSGITDAGIVLRTGASGTGRIYFGDNSGSESARKAGAIEYGHSSNAMLFYTDSTERLRIDSNGRVGINPDANGPDKLLHVSDTNNGGVVTPFRLTNAAGSAGTEVRMEFECGLDEIAYIGAKHEGSDTGPLTFATATSTNAYPSEKMRLTKSGQLLINRTSPNDDEMFAVFTDSTSHEMVNLRNNAASGTKDMITMIHVANSGDRVFMRFKRTGSVTNVGTITTGASSTAYNTSSDYRLKENAVAISDGITRLKTLKPYRFNFKVEPDKTVDGFFAHEVTAVPEAVHGEKDAVETTYYTDGDTIPEGKAVGDVKEENAIDPQSLDYSKFTPLLTAALQEAVTRIETLEAQIAALTGG